MLVGVDCGGTFTDFVVCDADGVRFHKQLSTPDDPSRAILNGIRSLGLDAGSLHLVHGSTVATNAVLERKGVRTLFVTNRGLEDLLALGRQVRRELYNLTPEPYGRLLPAEDCLGVGGRVDADGCLVEPIDEESLQALAERAGDYEAVAICTLFSFLNPIQESELAAVLPDHVFASLSHRVLPEYREYERASTTFLNAYVGPLVQRYLQRLQKRVSPRHLFIMHSTGGVMDVEEAGRHAVRMVLSGPAGGLVAARMVGDQLDRPRLLSFDMGGTSTDVALLDGEPQITSEGSIDGMPVAVPMLDIHTIGAGGGSLAWRDAAGLLRVGPQSAGAEPGPACYGRGGEHPTVTDAHVVLGHIPPSARLAGRMPLDVEAAHAAVAGLGREFGLDAPAMAAGIIRVAEENMAAALRVVSVQRGHDPAGFALLCFGGGGGLHACALAESLGMHEVILPAGSGAFSALGMLAGRRQCDLSRSRRLVLDDAQAMSEAEGLFLELESEAQQRMPDLQLHTERLADIRYIGQGFHLTLPWENDVQRLQQRFAEAHEKAYGHALQRGLEVMTLRLRAWADTPPLRLPELAQAGSEARPSGHSHVISHGEVPHYQRGSLLPGHCLRGPALVLEDTATLWLAPGWQARVSPHGHLLLGDGA